MLSGRHKKAIMRENYKEKKKDIDAQDDVSNNLHIINNYTINLYHL